jgi:hypothetical protein
MAGSTRRWTAKDNAALGVLLSGDGAAVHHDRLGCTGRARSVVLIRVSTVTGLIAAAVAGVALIYFGIAVVPGLTILFWTVRGAAAFTRRLAGERDRRFEE